MEETTIEHTTDPELPEGVTEIQTESTQQLQLDDSSEGVLNTETQKETQTTESTETTETSTSDLNTQIEKHTKAVDALAKDLKVKGIDFNDAVKEYNEYGALSSQTMADLAKAGYPKEVVESFIESRQVLESQFTDAVYKAAGGEQEYGRIVDWAKSNLPQKVVNSFNKAIDNNNLEAIELMLEGMKSKMRAQQGTRNPSILGGATNTASQKGFVSKSEVIEAMSDKRYGRDAAYTAEVERKMFYTNF